MRAFVFIVIVIIQSCSSTKSLSVKDVNYNDGINKNEAKALAKDFINKNKNRFCSTVYVYKLVNNTKEWKVELACDSYSADIYSSTPNPNLWRHKVFRDGGTLMVNKLNGNVYRAQKNEASK